DSNVEALGREGDHPVSPGLGGRVQNEFIHYLGVHQQRAHRVDGETSVGFRTERAALSPVPGRMEDPYVTVGLVVGCKLDGAVAVEHCYTSVHTAVPEGAVHRAAFARIDIAQVRRDAARVEVQQTAADLVEPLERHRVFGVVSARADVDER